MTKVKEIIGFGFDPSESKHHFLILIPKIATSKVSIYERFEWGTLEDENALVSSTLSLFDEPEQKIDQRFDRLKCELSRAKWKEIENAVKTEFNQRLKVNGQKAGRDKMPYSGS
jgi:hypothetical protein